MKAKRRPRPKPGRAAERTRLRRLLEEAERLRTRPAPAMKAHLCACADPTSHEELRARLGTSYVALRRGTFRLVLALLRRANDRVGAFRSDNVAVAKENARLRAALKKTLDLSVESPVFEGGLGGRTSVQTYRHNTGRLVQLMNEAGVRALLLGQDAGRLFLRTTFKLDLESIWAAPAATREEAERRDDLRYKLTVDEETDLLLRPDDQGERCRRDFMSAVAGSGVDTSVQELVRRSGELSRGREVSGASDD